MLENIPQLKGNSLKTVHNYYWTEKRQMCYSNIQYVSFSTVLLNIFNYMSFVHAFPISEAVCIKITKCGNYETTHL